MSNAYRVIGVVGCLLASLCGGAQVGGSARKIVLPNPQLIHCRSAECSQLWKQDSGDGGAVYPAQVLTDFVNGEVVGLTAVYDKSVSTQELRAAIETLYAKWKFPLDSSSPFLWRITPEQLVAELSERDDGTKMVVYLKIGKYGSHVPTAHIDGDNYGTENTPPDFTGFWKVRCSDAFGVQIKKQTGNLFSVSFCGPAAASIREHGRRTRQSQGTRNTTYTIRQRSRYSMGMAGRRTRNVRRTPIRSWTTRRCPSKNPVQASQRRKSLSWR
jgi:hypothetical protein